MVALTQVEFPFHGGVGRPRGPGFGRLVQVIGRTAIPFLGNYIVPAAKRVGADVLDFPAPEVAEVVSDRKNFKIAAKNAGRHFLRK